MCIEEIIEANNRLKGEIEYLRKISPYYPKVLLKNTLSEEIIATTLIRKKYDGKWYDVHLIQRAVVPIGENAEDLIEKVMGYAYRIILFHRVSDMDSLSKIQISEEERLNPQK